MFAGIVMLDKLVLLKTPHSRVVIPVGMLQLTKFVHPKNIPSPKLVIESGNVMLVNAVQPVKHLLPMLWQPFGMLIFCKEEQFSKALFPIFAKM